MGNRLKRGLPKSEGCASYFRGVNGRSQFVGHGVGSCRVSGQIQNFGFVENVTSFDSFCSVRPAVVVLFLVL